jgi:hypothetical protein
MQSLSTAHGARSQAPSMLQVNSLGQPPLWPGGQPMGTQWWSVSQVSPGAHVLASEQPGTQVIALMQEHFGVMQTIPGAQSLSRPHGLGGITHGPQPGDSPGGTHKRPLHWLDERQLFGQLVAGQLGVGSLGPRQAWNCSPPVQSGHWYILHCSTVMLMHDCASVAVLQQTLGLQAMSGQANGGSVVRRQPA